MTPARMLELYHAVHVAERALHDAIKLAYPPGAFIHYLWRGAVREGLVIHHGYGGRVYVKNASTGSRYWVSPDHICGA